MMGRGSLAHRRNTMILLVLGIQGMRRAHTVSTLLRPRRASAEEITASSAENCSCTVCRTELKFRYLCRLAQGSATLLMKVPLPSQCSVVVFFLENTQSQLSCIEPPICAAVLQRDMLHGEMLHSGASTPFFPSWCQTSLRQVFRPS